MNRRDLLLLAPALALATRAVAAPAAALPLATDLRADGALARKRRVPIVVLFSLEGCPYCEVVRRSHLGPMLRDPRQARRVIVRQIDIGSEQALVDFSGEQSTHARVARARDVAAAPVVSFWDGSGAPIAEPLRGMLLPDFYAAYLESAIETARARLAAPA